MESKDQSRRSAESATNGEDHVGTPQKMALDDARGIGGAATSPTVGIAFDGRTWRRDRTETARGGEAVDLPQFVGVPPLEAHERDLADT